MDVYSYRVDFSEGLIFVIVKSHDGMMAFGNELRFFLLNFASGECYEYCIENHIKHDLKHQKNSTSLHFSN